MGVTLDSFLDRLGLEVGEEARLCVLVAFTPEAPAGRLLSEAQVTECLGWVCAVHDKKMAFDTFCTLLETVLKELGNPLEPGQLESVARCMLSGYAQTEEADG